MSKYIVTVFDTEESAYEGSRAMLDLDKEGSIAVYAGAVISKDESGKVEVKQAADQGPIGMATGMLVGMMVGVLAGPLAAAGGVAAAGAASAAAAGMAGGGAIGSMTGLFIDMYSVGVGGDFLDEVSNALEPGKYAVVAEVEEGWTAPVDTRMEELGGTVFRRLRVDVEDEQIERNMEATERELEALNEEWNQSVGEAKEKLQAKIDAAKTNMKSLQDRANKKAESLKNELDAKIKKLDEQIAKAKDDAKAKFEKRRDEINEDYNQRIEKLKQAAKLTSEALS